MRYSAVSLISIGVCAIVISGAFVNYYGQVFQPSPLLNSNMKFWSFNPTIHSTEPYLWQIDIIKNPTDNVSVSRTIIADRPAVALSVFRSIQNGSSVWTTVHLRQDLHGQALDAIFNSTISVWVFPTFTYQYDLRFKNPENVFGIEINDGVNLVWYVFADDQNQVVQFPHQRIVVTQTPLHVWSYRTIDIAHEYAEAGWKKPDSLSFILILGTTNIYPGNWTGYFSGLNVQTTIQKARALSTVGIETLVVSDVILIGVLGGAGIVMRRRGLVAM